MNDNKKENVDLNTSSANDNLRQENRDLLSDAAYQRIVARRQKVQWVSFPIYCIAAITTILLVKIGPINEERFWWIILVVIYGGLFPLMFAVYGPYLRPLQKASLPDGPIAPPPTELDNPEGIRETNHISILYKIAVPMWLILGAPAVYFAISGARTAYPPLEFWGSIAALHLFLTWWLGRITAEANPAFFRVGMGPFKSTTPIKEIESIRSVAVRPLREFLGWGWRVKADGTRGYIADLNVGVEFMRNDGRRTVVTVQDPQRFVDYVRWAKVNQAT